MNRNEQCNNTNTVYTTAPWGSALRCDVQFLFGECLLLITSIFRGSFRHSPLELCAQGYNWATKAGALSVSPTGMFRRARPANRTLSEPKTDHMTPPLTVTTNHFIKLVLTVGRPTTERFISNVNVLAFFKVSFKMWVQNVPPMWDSN